MTDTNQANAVAVRGPAWLPAVDNRAEIDLIKKTYAKGLQDNELQLFVSHANQMGLSIIKKQIYAIVRGSGEYRQMGIQVGIDGYRAITEANPEFNGYTEPQWCGADGVWVEVWLKKEPPAAARIGILRKGFEKPIWGIATYDEFVQTTYDKYTKTQKPNSMWQKMPANQLLKCAEAAAHRRATPGVLSGTDMYEEPDPEVEASEVMGRRTVTVSGLDDQESWDKANRRLRAVASEAKVSDRQLHLYVASKGKDSLTELSASELNGLANSIKNRPDKLGEFFANLDRQFGDIVDGRGKAHETEPNQDDDEYEGEYVEVDESTGEMNSTADEYADINAAVGAAWDAQQQRMFETPTSHPNHGDS